MNVIKETHSTAEGFFVACLCLFVCVVGGGCCWWDVRGCACVSLRQCHKPEIVEVVCRCCCYLLLHTSSSFTFNGTLRWCCAAIAWMWHEERMVHVMEQGFSYVVVDCLCYKWHVRGEVVMCWRTLPKGPHTTRTFQTRIIRTRVRSRPTENHVDWYNHLNEL